MNSTATTCIASDSIKNNSIMLVRSGDMYQARIIFKSGKVMTKGWTNFIQAMADFNQGKALLSIA